MEEVRRVKKWTKQRKVGIGCGLLGARPLFPVVLVPGFASSALEAIVTPEKVNFIVYIFLYIICLYSKDTCFVSCFGSWILGAIVPLKKANSLFKPKIYI